MVDEYEMKYRRVERDKKGEVIIKRKIEGSDAEKAYKERLFDNCVEGIQDELDKFSVYLDEPLKAHLEIEEI